MNKLSVIFCLWLILQGCSNASVSGGEKGQIEGLVQEWASVSPTKIGGPSELKNIKEIKQIVVGEIAESKWNNVGCKDCKDSEATIVGVSNEGATEEIHYQVRKLDGYWVITAWETTSGAKGNFYPYIDLEVIKARKAL